MVYSFVYVDIVFVSKDFLGKPLGNSIKRAYPYASASTCKLVIIATPCCSLASIHPQDTNCLMSHLKAHNPKRKGIQNRLPTINFVRCKPTAVVVGNDNPLYNSGILKGGRCSRKGEPLIFSMVFFDSLRFWLGFLTNPWPWVPSDPHPLGCPSLSLSSWTLGWETNHPWGAEMEHKPFWKVSAWISNIGFISVQQHTWQKGWRVKEPPKWRFSRFLFIFPNKNATSRWLVFHWGLSLPRHRLLSGLSSSFFPS